MKAEERTISNILTEQICYEIPPYQRPYSWEIENVHQLLEDVWEAYEAEESEYFIGSTLRKLTAPICGSRQQTLS